MLARSWKGFCKNMAFFATSSIQRSISASSVLLGEGCKQPRLLYITKANHSPHDTLSSNFCRELLLSSAEKSKPTRICNPENRQTHPNLPCAFPYLPRRGGRSWRGWEGWGIVNADIAMIRIATISNRLQIGFQLTSQMGASQSPVTWPRSSKLERRLRPPAQNTIGPQMLFGTASQCCKSPQHTQHLVEEV